MSEAILKALMQLFALIGDIHADTVITSRERNIVRIFLIRHLNNELVEKYMNMFTQYLSQFNSERIVRGSLRDRKRISLNAMRILAICEKINEELEQKQKIYVIIKLIDYILSGERITETELDFLKTVATSFNIPPKEYSDMKNFIMDPSGQIHGNVLVISNKKNETDDVRHVYNGNLKGNIRFLNIQSTNTWLMSYSGMEELYLNGQVIDDGETYIFDNGSSIRGSGITAIYYSEVAGLLSAVSYSSVVSLASLNVTFRFRNSENGVQDLNFRVRSGELAGIMGGSGVGKSTALSILSGTVKPQKGSVLINGFDLYNDDEREKLTGVIGFVPQDDLLIGELTVYQNLYYNAKMCLSNLPEDKLNESVERMLYDLDLYEASDLKVGNPLNKVISGGQRKRINIALELMREPTILFVDEPTSGLSSVDSEIVMNLLKDLTYKGKLVVVNIHQPSSDIYKMFDKIMIIDRGGYQVYYGNPLEAIIYFKIQTNHANPGEDQCTKCGNVDTEQLLRTIEAKVIDELGRPSRLRKVSPGEWAERFKAFKIADDNPQDRVKRTLPENKYSIPSLLKQSLIFFTRDLLSKISDRQYIIISLLGPPLLAFLLSYFIKAPSDYVFSKNESIPAYLFMCVITSMFFGLMASSEEIVSDRKILKRESFLNLSWFSYLNSKIMIMFMLSAVQTLSFVVIGNFILEIKGMTLAYWLVLFTTSCFGNVMGLNLSSAFRSVLTIYILIPFIIIPQLLFSGVLVKFDRLNINQHEYVPFIGDIMIARWSFEALAVKQFRDNDYEKLFFDHELVESGNSWNAMLVDELKTGLSICEDFRDSAGYEEIVVNNFNKLSFYTSRLSGMAGLEFPERIRASLHPDRFEASAEKPMNAFLDSLKVIFVNRMGEAIEVQNGIFNKLIKEHGEEWLIDLRSRHENERLREYVLGENTIDQSVETDHKIIRKYQPGLMKPASRAGRAHFYAPVKNLGGIETDTYISNVSVVWAITLLLYLLLYFKIPEKLVTAGGNLFLTHGE